MTKAGGRSTDEDRAAAYDGRVRAAIPGYETLHTLSCRIAAAAAGPSGRVLVVGAGTGAECIALAQDRPDLSLTGVDPSAAMLAVAAAKVTALGLDQRVRLYPRTLAEMPPTVPFDVATLLLVLHFLKDDGAKRALLAEIAARLRPGAVLVLADLFGDPADPGHGELLTWWRCLQQAAGIPAEEIDRGFRLVERDIHPLTEARLAALLAETGFTPPRPFFRALCFGGWVTRRG